MSEFLRFSAAGHFLTPLRWVKGYGALYLPTAYLCGTSCRIQTKQTTTMPISWNEIKSRAFKFVNEWKDTEREEADAQSFLIELLDVFGVSRKRVATFEHKVKKLDESSGYIDLLWPGTLLVEMKSRGKDLEKAYKQAKEYCQTLKDHELPSTILISDFETFHFYDESSTKHVFKLKDLSKNLNLFSHIAGYQKQTFKDQDPVNIEAAELMGKLHDQLKTNGYEGHDLELYLVRLLFILFADDTNIFERGIFLQYLSDRTNEDGSDLALHIAQLFEVLNTEENKRQRNLDDQLKQFPYVNGKLFEERLPLAAFNSRMRAQLISCCSLDWSAISPAIFGSLFQSVMDEKARRNLGAHYTSEKNILKVIRPLFMNDLTQELVAAGENKTKLQKLHQKIAGLRFLDPACGCGNFLVIAYRELRLLELEIVKRLLKNQSVTNIAHYFLVDVDQFYGIEYEEFPAQIAQVAMWLIDHQMNMVASQAFGEYMPRIPLRKSAVIKYGNALEIPWSSLSPDQAFSYIMGNPPFLGKQLLSTGQRDDMDRVFEGVEGAGLLDYVTAWYLLAAKYMESDKGLKNNETTKVAFVSTNSVIQGEQVSILWGPLMTKYKVKILFAHRTFKWSNEARNNAAVYCVIIGFANFDSPTKAIYDYPTVTSEPVELTVRNINPYLVEGDDIVIRSRSKSICGVGPIINGSKPVDGGNLIFTQDEKNEFLISEPGAAKYFRVFAGADDFINGKTRWCLWLTDITPSELSQLPKVLERVNAVRQFRLRSPKVFTQKRAETPTLFEQIRQPNSDFLLVPRHSSENRKYLTIGFLNKNVIVSDSATFIPNASLFTFGVLSSSMHMVWVKYVCGRIKSDYRYSNDIVFNNYPWPENTSPKQVVSVEDAAKAVLEARAQFPGSSLADLYDVDTIPPVLVTAHHRLDKAVDQCYRSQPFPSDMKRIEFLFELYEKYTGGLFVESKPKKKSRQSTS